MIENLENTIRDFLNIGGFGRKLREGFHGGDLIELLEIAAAKITLIAGAGDHDHRPAVDGGVGEAGEAVDAAGAGDGEEDAGAAGEEAVGGGSVAGGLLVVEGDESDAESDGAVGEGGDGDADNAEHAVHAGT